MTNIVITSKIVNQKVITLEEKPETKPAKSTNNDLLNRPEALNGTTVKIKPPGQRSIYITLNTHTVDGKVIPYEMFLESRSLEHSEWMISTATMVSAIFRTGIDVGFLIKNLKETPSHSPYFVPGKKGLKVLGVVSHIGHTLEEILISKGYFKTTDTSTKKDVKGGLCPSCGSYSLVKESGCCTCHSCSYSSCG